MVRMTLSIGVALGVLASLTARVLADTSESDVSGQQKRLLVVVEGTFGPGHDASEIRRAIADELQTSVIGPSHESDGQDDPDLLIVGVNGKQISMSMMASPREHVSRSIPSPTDPAARRKAIAWLAGNLARDQVSAIVAAPASSELPATPDAPVAATTPIVTPATVDPVLQPPPLASASGEPAVASGAAFKPVDLIPEMVVASKPTSSPPSGPGWRVSAAAGFTALSIPGYWGDRNPIRSYEGPSFERNVHIEIQHCDASARSWGVALEFGQTFHHFGAAAFIGHAWRHNRWFLEANLGLGVEETMGATRNATYTDSSTTGQVNTVTVFERAQTTIYAQGTATFGISVSSSFDLLAHVSAHVSAGGLEPFFITTPMLGVRYRLP